MAASENIVNSASSSSYRGADSTSTSDAESQPPAELIARNTLLDGYLFLVRHLLILREVPTRFGLGAETLDTNSNGKTSSWSDLEDAGVQKASTASVSGWFLAPFRHQLAYTLLRYAGFNFWRWISSIYISNIWRPLKRVWRYYNGQKRRQTNNRQCQASTCLAMLLQRRVP